MRINVRKLRDLPDQPVPFDFLEEMGTLEHKGRKLKLRAAIRSVGDAVWQGQTMHLHGKVTTQIETECSRCLTSLISPIALEEDLEFREEGPENEFWEASWFGFAHGAEEIDLLPYVQSLILSALDSKPLCSPTCKGLCPQCGANLNRGRCRCPAERESVDPRWARLKELLS